MRHRNPKAYFIYRQVARTDVVQIYRSLARQVKGFPDLEEMRGLAGLSYRQVLTERRYFCEMASDVRIMLGFPGSVH